MIELWQAVFRQDWVTTVFLSAATISVAVLLTYTLLQFHLLWLYVRYGLKRNEPAAPLAASECPHVAVQVPIYNEVYMAAGVIRSVAALDWPADRLHIQILDDSDDGVTTDRIREACATAKAAGVDVVALRRPDRTGYKAGNLANGLLHTDAPFIAVIDADFRPRPDFLQKVMPRFTDPGIGCVQTRPEHANREFSWLTLAQALMHDAFYLVEQQARHASGCFTRFNGTGAVWRRSALDAAGGWQFDTISEDMDLAYRAQITGWRIYFDMDVQVPAELPVSVQDFKIQQYRWAKGRAQVIRKVLPSLLRTPLPLRVKAHALLDLLNIYMVPAGMVLAIGSLWFVLVGWHPWLAVISGPFMVAQASAMLLPLFTLAALRHYGKGWRGTAREWLRCFPLTLPLLLALAPLMTAGLVSGLLKRPPVFHATAKYNVMELDANWKSRRFPWHGIHRSTWLEGMFALYFAFALWAGISLGVLTLLAFHSILALGYATVFTYSIYRA